MLQNFWPVLNDVEEILWLHTYYMNFKNKVG